MKALTKGFRFLIFVAAVVIAASAKTAAFAQGGVAVSLRNGLADPAQCQPTSLNIFVNRTTNVLRLCTAANTWADVGGISQAAADLRYLQLSGGTMTGAILPNADGTIAFGGALKHWSEIYTNGVYSAAVRDSDAQPNKAFRLLGTAYGASMGLALSKDAPAVWSSTADAGGAADVGLKRASAGVLQVTDGAAGDGSLYAASIKDRVGSYYALNTANGLGLANGKTIGFAAANPLVPDVILDRDAANTLALRNGANAQTFNIYNTTDGTNKEYASLKWSGTRFEIDSRNAAGTGTNRNLALIGYSTLYLYANTALWTLSSGGVLAPGTDNAFDIGDATHRVRFGYFSTIYGGNVMAIGYNSPTSATIASAGQIDFGVSGYNTPDLGLKRTSAGVLTVSDGGAGYGKIAVADGTAAAPSILKGGTTDTGLHWTSNSLMLSQTGGDVAGLRGNYVTTNSGGHFSFTSTSDAGGAIDTSLTRIGAGVVKLENATGPTTFFGGGSAVASATALPVPVARVYHVTGTTTITSITSTNVQSGAIITLIFDGALTFTDGSNLKLAGNFVTTADDTITLVYDGTNWFETSRSVN